MFAPRITKLHVYLKTWSNDSRYDHSLFPDWCSVLSFWQGHVNNMCVGGVLIAVSHVVCTFKSRYDLKFLLEICVGWNLYLFPPPPALKQNYYKIFERIRKQYFCQNCQMVVVFSEKRYLNVRSFCRTGSDFSGNKIRSNVGMRLTIPANVTKTGIIIVICNVSTAFT